MNLALDFGNTTTRLYLFEGAKFISKKVFKKFNAKTLKTVLKKHEIDASIISSVADFDKKITNELRRHTHFINLTYKTPVPILNKYETPKTLGMDRLGNAVAASALHPHDHVLVIDAGTCIKYDFINWEKEYFGGSISPGFRMRLRALHHYTEHLPLLKPKQFKHAAGANTIDSILSGVYHSIRHEMNGFIHDYASAFEDIKVIMTGGDCHYFAEALNFPIFAEPDLTGIGLNEILLHNRNK
jgi:type III pantothenate kinase